MKSEFLAADLQRSAVVVNSGGELFKIFFSAQECLRDPTSYAMICDSEVIVLAMLKLRALA